MHLNVDKEDYRDIIFYPAAERKKMQFEKILGINVNLTSRSAPTRTVWQGRGELIVK